jgi:aromatic-L-amino-acid decarboxylase
MLVQTEINGIYCMRMAIGAQRTTEKHIRHAFNIFEEEATQAIDIWREKSQDTTDLVRVSSI